MESAAVIHGGCHPGMPQRVNDEPGTGCRADCLHRAMVERYRELKAAEAECRLRDREAATNGHNGSERAEWEATHPQLTFQQYLLDNRRTEESAP